MNKENVNYTITWRQPLTNWDPLKIQVPESKELEITDFAEAQKVLAKFMTKFDNK